MSVEIRLANEGEVPIITIIGRLDGYGAQQLDSALKEIIRDDTRSAIFNLAGVEYLASSGIRVLLGLRKRLKQREGQLALINVQDFPKKVLEMSGFLKVLDIYPSLKEAEIACRERISHEGLLFGIKHPSFDENGVYFEVENGSQKPASLVVTGEISKVIDSLITIDDVYSLDFHEAEYSLGLGALGKDVNDAMHLMGEMITLHGSMVYVPTDGHFTPDFFTPVRDTGEVKIFTGFNVALSGPFHELITFETGETGSVTVSDIYRAVFTRARAMRSDYTGIVSLVIWGIVEGVISSEIKHSPLLENAPANRKSIMDPTNYTEWNDTNEEPRYRGDTLLSFGFGIDLSSDLVSFQPGAPGSLYYIHPKNHGENTMFLHNHGVIFRNIPYDAKLELSRQVRSILADGDFIDMRHLMDETRLLKGKIGVSFISSINKRA